MVGTRMGPCAVASPLGAGGMGEVYRARGWLIQVQVLLRFIWQCAAVVLLRRYRPDIPQPFTMWLYPWPAILSGALWLFIFFTGPWEGIVFSFAFLAAGLAAYGLFVRQKN